MKLIINGKQEELNVTTLDQVVEKYNLKKGLVVTEVNGEIIDKDNWEQTEISEGMKIEIVHFVGGG